MCNWASKPLLWLAAALAAGLDPSAPAADGAGQGPAAGAYFPPATRRSETSGKPVIPAAFTAPVPDGQRPSRSFPEDPDRPAGGPDARGGEFPALSAPRPQQPLPPLSRPGSRRSSSGTKPAPGVAAPVAWAAGLAVVLGLFLLIAWVIRRAAPNRFTPLPRDVIEVLGRAPLATHHHLQLVRCGPKLLLLSVTTSGAETLTEITDPDEVARLVGLCRQSQPGSTTQVFRQVFEQFASGRRGGDRHG